MKKKDLKLKPNPQLPNGMKPIREVSAMAWIENEFGHVLMIRQAQGNQLWTLPGGKVCGTEEILETLDREVREEIGVGVASSRLVSVYDRAARQNLTVLYSVKLKVGTFLPKNPEEIAKIAFKTRLPSKASPSARFFWAQRHSIHTRCGPDRKPRG